MIFVISIYTVYISNLHLYSSVIWCIVVMSECCLWMTAVDTTSQAETSLLSSSSGPWPLSTAAEKVCCWLCSLWLCVHVCACIIVKSVVVSTRDVPDIRFRLAGYPAIFSNPVPAKTVPGTGYLSWIVLGPFWQLVSPSEWAPYCKTVGLHDSLVVRTH